MIGGAYQPQQKQQQKKLHFKHICIYKSIIKVHSSGRQFCQKLLVPNYVNNPVYVNCIQLLNYWIIKCLYFIMLSYATIQNVSISVDRFQFWETMELSVIRLIPGCSNFPGFPSIPELHSVCACVRVLGCVWFRVLGSTPNLFIRTHRAQVFICMLHGLRYSFEHARQHSSSLTTGPIYGQNTHIRTLTQYIIVLQYHVRECTCGGVRVEAIRGESIAVIGVCVVPTLKRAFHSCRMHACAACVCPGASLESASNQVHARTFTFRPAIRHDDDASSSCTCTCSTSGHAFYTHTQTPTCVYFTSLAVCIKILVGFLEKALGSERSLFIFCLWFFGASNNDVVSWCTCTTDSPKCGATDVPRACLAFGMGFKRQYKHVEGLGWTVMMGETYWLRRYWCNGFKMEHAAKHYNFVYFLYVELVYAWLWNAFIHEVHRR